MSEEQPHDTLFKQAMSRPDLAASELRAALGSELISRIDLCQLDEASRDAFAPFVPDFRYLVDDLARASHLEMLSERVLEPALRLVSWVLRDGRSGAHLLQNPDDFFALLQAIAERNRHVDLVDLAFVYPRIVFPESSASDLEALARAATQKYPEGAHIAMNSLQKLYERDRQEGRQEGKADTLRLLLETRFGPLTPEQADHVETLEGLDLDDALRRFITADSVEAVIG